jgi:hypothetical protein
MKTAFDKTQWFREAEYGFFFHFLNSGSSLHPPSGKAGRTFLSPAEWNRQVDSFDVEHMARQLHDLRAGYAFLTVGQNSGYYCAPNATYDQIMGLSGKDSKCSGRDLVADFADELAKVGIPLLVYTTTLAPGFDFDAVRNLKSIPPWNCNANCGNYEDVKQFAGTDPRLKEFQRMWNAIHAEWMGRWGGKVKGWWVDGCYFADRMYHFPDEPNGDSFANALRTNNPDAIVAFNPGVVCPPRPVYPRNEDFTAGEINDPAYGLLNGSMVNGLQYHVLTYAGQGWGRGPLRGNGQHLAELTRNIVDNGGVVSWDIPFTTAGISQEVFGGLKVFADAYHDSLAAFPKTSVAVTAPYFDFDGLPVAGKAAFASDSSAEIVVEWNGQPCGSGHGKSWAVDLPALPAEEALLSLSCGGFSRSLPVAIGRSFRFTETPSPVISLKASGQAMADYSFAVNNHVLFIDALIFERESQIEPTPWAGSCLELFLSQRPDQVRQICIRADGKTFAVDCAAAVACPLVNAKRIELDDHSYRLQAAVPLAMIKDYVPSKKAFAFEIQQSVTSDNGILRNTLFAPSALLVGAYAHVRFD